MKSSQCKLCLRSVEHLRDQFNVYIRQMGHPEHMLVLLYKALAELSQRRKQARPHGTKTILRVMRSDTNRITIRLPRYAYHWRWSQKTYRCVCRCYLRLFFVAVAAGGVTRLQRVCVHADWVADSMQIQCARVSAEVIAWTLNTILHRPTKSGLKRSCGEVFDSICTELTTSQRRNLFIIIIIILLAVQYANQVQQFNKNNEQDTPAVA